MKHTVADLIEALQQEDPARLVVLSSDAEGNRYSPLAGFDLGLYEAETAWSGTMRAEDDVDASGKPALVLYPIN